MAILGNHDYEGSIPAYLAYKNDSRWYMPARNYTYVVKDADLTVVAMDTQRACPSYMSSP